MIIIGHRTNYNRLCLLCHAYISKNRWKKHLKICEKNYKKENKKVLDYIKKYKKINPEHFNWINNYMGMERFLIPSIITKVINKTKDRK